MDLYLIQILPMLIGAKPINQSTSTLEMTANLLNYVEIRKTSTSRIFFSCQFAQRELLVKP